MWISWESFKNIFYFKHLFQRQHAAPHEAEDQHHTDEQTALNYIKLHKFSDPDCFVRHVIKNGLLNLEVKYTVLISS